MAINIARRRFIAALGGTAFAWPLPARAQQSQQVRRLGVLMMTAESDPLGQQRIAALRAGLQELGWRQGGNLRIDLRWAGGDASRLKDYTAELLRLAPDVISRCCVRVINKVIIHVASDANADHPNVSGEKKRPGDGVSRHYAKRCRPGREQADAR
jgi:hypothetical protein